MTKIICPGCGAEIETETLEAVFTGDTPASPPPIVDPALEMPAHQPEAQPERRNRFRKE